MCASLSDSLSVARLRALRASDRVPRRWELWIEVSGHAPLTLVAYAHYLNEGPGGGSAELEALMRRLPEAVAVGTWHWFPSMLSKRTIPLS